MNPNQRRHTISFKHAFDGILHTFKSQPNMRIHGTLALGAIALGWWLHISRIEWGILIFTILWVIISEMINTSIEAMVDLITTEHRQQAKIAKDVAAGTVLIGAIGALIVGSMLFIPKIIHIIGATQ